ncbi:MAG: hypothetical protein RSE44_30075, partial [Pseudomonas sp.]
EAGQLSVAENATTAATGHFSIHSEAGVASISVGGTSVSLAQLSGLGSPGASPVTVSTAKGDLTLTGYNAATGEVSYSYTVKGAQDHSAGDQSVSDVFGITVTDVNSVVSGNASLTVLITDTNPVAQGESHEVTEDSGSYTVGGDVLVNDSAFDGPVKFAGWNGSTSGS